MRAPVVVIGAGPVGLTAAANLAHFNIPVRILDSRPAPSKLSKALVIWRRTLLTLDPLLPYQHWLKQGTRLKGVNLADNGALFGSLDLDRADRAIPPSSAAPAKPAAEPEEHMIPPGISITQAQVETALEQLLHDKYNITVERGTQLESFTVDEAAGEVRCVVTKAPPDASGSTVQPTAPQQEVVVASYLIGCDGARSAVRKGLGVAFEGFSDPHNRFLMMDATYEHVPGINSHTPQHEAEGVPQPDRPMANTSAAGLVLFFPLVDARNAIRLVWNAGRDGPATATLDDFQDLLMRHTRLQIKLKEVLWQSEFAVNERMVASYVHHGGRVLLAGDAAHVHSPAGGQGMNTGIQDAANLAWKVAMAAAGDVSSSAGLLETYQEERHPQGEAAIRFSGLLLRANAIRNPVLRFIRRVVVGALTRSTAVQHALASTLTEDNVSCEHGSLASASGPGHSTRTVTCAGTAFPDVSISIDGVMRPATDLLRGARGCLGSLVLLAPPAAQLTSVPGVAAAASFGTGGDANIAWPTHWGHWPLHTVLVSAAAQGNSLTEAVATNGPLKPGVDGSITGGCAGGTSSLQGTSSKAAAQGGTSSVDTWGLLEAAVGGAAGVLVRPDGIIGVVGGPQEVVAWLDAHGFRYS